MLQAWAARGSRTILPLIFLLGSMQMTRGAPLEGSSQRWSTRTWQIPDDSSSRITGVAQSPDGYLWIATTTGLKRFDGVHFDAYDIGPRLGLPESGIELVLPSRDGGLWLAMNGAIVLLKLDAPARVLRRGVPAGKPDSIVEDDAGVLWIGYHNGPVCRVVGDKVIPFPAETGITSGGTPSLAKDIHGQIWLARGSQIGVIRDGKFVSQAQASRYIHFAAASQGGLWVCAGRGLYRFEEATGLKHLADLPPNDKSSGQLKPFEDSRGQVWIGSTHDGLLRFDGSGFQNIPTPQARITCIAEDREGNLWAGTDAGLDRISPRAIDLEGAESGLPLGSINSICQGPDGRMWACTVDGSLIVRDATGPWTAAPVEFKGAATCVTCDATGGIWIGTMNRRLHRWRNGHLDSWDSTSGLASHTVCALLAASNNDLWIASYSPYTLQRFRDGHFTDFRLPQTFGRVDALAEDRNGDIWAGRSGKGGLLRVHDDQPIDETDRVGGRPIHSLYVTPDNSLWIGFNGDGLGRLKDGHFTLITSKQGLYNENISQIVPDDRGWLWFGSEAGVFKIRQQELDLVADAKAPELQSIHFGGNEGLPPLQAKIELAPSAMRSRDGRIWMAMATGVVVIRPDRLADHMDPPAVQIQRVKVDDQELVSSRDFFNQDPQHTIGPAISSLRLQPNYHRLEFDFTTLTFSAPEDARFRYRLESLDETWNETTGLRKAVYPRLPAGSYRFRVIGCNADGVWNMTGETISITVEPFVWQTWWFRTIGIVFIGAAMLVLVRYISFRRLRQRLLVLQQRNALERERARIARDIHDDLGHGLTQIVLLSEATTQEANGNHELAGQLRQILSTAKQGIRSLDETVWAINPRNDTLADLIDYVGHFVVESLRPAGIRWHLDLPDHPEDLTVPSEVRHNLFLSVKEAVNNILRHARAQNVWLSINLSEQVLTIRIADDGCGFLAPESPAVGQDGLRNMQQRMQDVGGSFSLESAPGAGTKISMSYSFPRVRTLAMMSQERPVN